MEGREEFYYALDLDALPTETASLLNPASIIYHFSRLQRPDINDVWRQGRSADHALEKRDVFEVDLADFPAKFQGLAADDETYIREKLAALSTIVCGILNTHFRQGRQGISANYLLTTLLDFQKSRQMNTAFQAANTFCDTFNEDDIAEDTSEEATDPALRSSSSENPLRTSGRSGITNLATAMAHQRANEGFLTGRLTLSTSSSSSDVSDSVRPRSGSR